MSKITKIKTACLGLFILFLIMPINSSWAQGIVADHEAVAAFPTIPPSAIEDVTSDIHMYYRHTSHGSQPLQGMSMLLSEDNLYQYFDIYEESGDLGANGDTSWVIPIRAYLDESG